MVVQYKCPGCGNDLAFDSATGMLRCPSCGHTMSIDQVPKTDASHTTHEETPDVGTFNPHDIEDECSYEYHSQKEASHSTFHESDVNEYHCNNCGAIIIADKDTTATQCSYCGSPVVLADRLSGNLAPAKVIPFRISKQEAQEKFKKWCKNGRFVPKSFQTAQRVKNITGMYVPFWLYDMNGKGNVDATCTRVNSYTRGDYQITETSYFHVYRKFDLNYLKIPVDASEKMNDELMDKLEPYNYSDLKSFEMPYLAGFLAEKYNYNDSDLYPRIRDRVNSYINEYVRSTMAGYATTRINRQDTNIIPRNSFYTMLPVWMVYYDYNDSEHVFAMNGQTGKIVGKPPIDKGKVMKWFFYMSALGFAGAKVLGIILGGGLL